MGGCNNNLYCSIIQKKSFPLSEPMDGSALKGCLLNNAYYLKSEEEPSVRLTEADADLNGQISYRGELPSVFSSEFEFKHIENEESDSADAVYFYFYCDEVPTSEYDEDITGYIVGFSEFSQEITVTYNGDIIGQQEIELVSDEWYNARILFSEGHFWIYLNDQFKVHVGNSEHVLNQNNIKWGLGARTGGSWAEHHVRQMTVQEEIDIPEILEPQSFLTYGIDNSSVLYDVSVNMEGGNSLVKDFSKPYIKFHSTAFSLDNTNNVFILAQVEIESTNTMFYRKPENGPLEELSLNVIGNITGHVITSMTYYDGHFIVSIISQSNVCSLYTLSDNEGTWDLEVLNETLDRIYGIFEENGDLYCTVQDNFSEGEQCRIFLYDPETGERQLTEVDPVTVPIVFGEGFEDITGTIIANGLSKQLISSSPHFITGMLLNSTAHGTVYCLVVIDASGNVTRVSYMKMRFTDLIYHPTYNSIISISNGDYNEWYKPDTLYVIANYDGDASVYSESNPLEFLQLTYDEGENSSAICWNKNDGCLYRFVIKSYGGN
jgi:hypothetical protein